MARRSVENVPSAARLGEALRDVGYDFVGAVADLIDNSIAAGATRVDVTARFAGPDSWVRIADNGAGMATASLNEAMRFGSRSDYDQDDLGKFGLGLKTASLSQCRRLLVATRVSRERARIEARALDLDVMAKNDTWEVDILGSSERPPELIEPLQQRTGTVVLWQNLDRLLPYRRPEGEIARKGLYSRLDQLDQHLAMVFHRFLAGDIPRRKRLKITINNNDVASWDPFARDEPSTESLPTNEFDVIHHAVAGVVTFHPYVLPNKHRFSSPAAHERYGRNRWNQSQGLWVYRANRLIQAGGWSYLRTSDEHTKYARAALEFFPELDDAFGINIAKMRVNLPSTLRKDLQAPVDALVRRAKTRYAAGAKQAPPPAPPSPGLGRTRGKDRTGVVATGSTFADPPAAPPARPLGEVIEEAAVAVDKIAALKKIRKKLREMDPGVADVLGW